MVLFGAANCISTEMTTRRWLKPGDRRLNASDVAITWKDCNDNSITVPTNESKNKNKRQSGEERERKSNEKLLMFKVKFPDVLFFLQNLYDTVTREEANGNKRNDEKEGEKSTQERTMLSLDTAVQTLLFWHFFCLFFIAPTNRMRN